MMESRIDPRWARELRVAAEWWKGPILAAHKKAFPPDSLFGALGDQVIKESNLQIFVDEFVIEVDAYFKGKGVEWDLEFPSNGSMRRRIGIEGAFKSEPVKKALSLCGLDEIITFLPKLDENPIESPLFLEE